jgi:hypothetical protein
MYQYALNEYAQTVAPATSNDDGRSAYSTQEDPEEARSTISDRASSYGYNANSVGEPSQLSSIAELRSRSSSDSGVVKDQPSKDHAGDNNFKAQYVPQEAAAQYVLQEAKPPPSSPQQQQQYNTPRYPLAEPTMPDATYEEHYGDAYVGGPIRYVYPSGYQSMRPRGGPWKLSIAVCLMFTWLSIFIIGHCSDRVDQTQYDQNEIDDDTLVIETRWCGSRLLYLMWVVSMLITSVATAYCSVIGYIKVRDFAVANSRSQPPGMVGKSDYYVQILDSVGAPHGNVDDDDDQHYRKTIYQADGTPQFWGGHIYRPTQAAVAITSR